MSDCNRSSDAIACRICRTCRCSAMAARRRGFRLAVFRFAVFGGRCSSSFCCVVGSEVEIRFSTSSCSTTPQPFPMRSSSSRSNPWFTRKRKITTPTPPSRSKPKPCFRTSSAVRFLAARSFAGFGFPSPNCTEWRKKPGRTFSKSNKEFFVTCVIMRGESCWSGWDDRGAEDGPEADALEDACCCCSAICSTEGKSLDARLASATEAGAGTGGAAPAPPVAGAGRLAFLPLSNSNLPIEEELELAAPPSPPRGSRS
mmetsp:Transcript_9698/g.23875  ORF Transcript_9698/g.23875 Transcript_9698/m.23875 type:complete len:257 (+) Transcript_9698:440-1210(+)